MNCWEMKKCGRDLSNDCPAYPANGCECWRVAGTMCGGKVQGTFAQKLVNCMECDFYKAVKRSS
ncbi:MAG: hypothetical protein QME41_01970 [Actinomycetota bacterium]|nr:hypothetical protein [Actinomycetota bacterium]